MKFSFDTIISVILLPKLLFQLALSPRSVVSEAFSLEIKDWDKNHVSFGYLVALSLFLLAVDIMPMMPDPAKKDGFTAIPENLGISGQFGASTFWSTFALATFYLVLTALWLAIVRRGLKREWVELGVRAAVLFMFVFLTSAIVENFFHVPGNYRPDSVFYDPEGYRERQLRDWRFWIGRLIIAYGFGLGMMVYVLSIIAGRRRRADPKD